MQTNTTDIISVQPTLYVSFNTQASTVRLYYSLSYEVVNDNFTASVRPITSAPYQPQPPPFHIPKVQQVAHYSHDIQQASHDHLGNISYGSIPQQIPVQMAEAIHSLQTKIPKAHLQTRLFWLAYIN